MLTIPNFIQRVISWQLELIPRDEVLTPMSNLEYLVNLIYMSLGFGRKPEQAQRERQLHTEKA